jgi:hypothetical protein
MTRLFSGVNHRYTLPFAIPTSDHQTRKTIVLRRPDETAA